VAQSELLILALQAFRASDSAFLLTGSLVSSLQDESRTTHDIDVVVMLTEDCLAAFLEVFPAGEYSYDIDSLKSAVTTGQMFYILSSTGDRLNVWPLGSSEFDQSLFSRRQQVELFNQPAYVSSPEDTILIELLWAKQLGNSEKQLFDAAKAFEMHRENIDNDYLIRWVIVLDLFEQRQAMRRFLA
jgi:hypothetical protein